jgi:hypothetical protein
VLLALAPPRGHRPSVRSLLRSGASIRRIRCVTVGTDPSEVAYLK